MEKRLIGKLGEKLACKWYTDRKYKLLDINYKTRLGEIDIIAMKKKEIVFIEVKTRKNSNFYEAKEAVTFSKQSKIKAAAAQFLAENDFEDFKWQILDNKKYRTEITQSYFYYSSS